MIIRESIRSPSRNTDDEEDYGTYEVEKIVAMRQLPNGVIQFLIRWKGYGSEDDTWENEGNLDCPDVLAHFFDQLQNQHNQPAN